MYSATPLLLECLADELGGKGPHHKEDHGEKEEDHAKAQEEADGYL